MVKVDNIVYSYSRSLKKTLDNIGFEIEDGQCVAILGNNGAGKSTLIKCIDHIYPTKEGSVIIDDENIFLMNGRTKAQNIAYVPQHSHTIDMTVFDTVLLGRKPYVKWDITSDDRAIAEAAIHKMGLEDYVLRNVSELSGGEFQKVTLARSLAQEPKLLLLDEPTSNLDPRNQHDVLNTISNIAHEHNICVMIVIHDLNLAVRYCDKFLFLKDSKVYAYGGLEVMTPETIRNVYGMDAAIINHGQIPVIIPFPDKKQRVAAN